MATSTELLRAAEKTMSAADPEMKAKAAQVAEHLSAALLAAIEWRQAGNCSLCESEDAIGDLIDTWRLAARGVV